MNTLAWGLAALTAAFALVEWWAVWTERTALRRITKPATLVALIAVAVALDPVDERIRVVMVIGLVLSLAGDVFLLGPRPRPGATEPPAGQERWFLAGLVSFLLAHIAYIVALQLAPTSVGWMLVGLAAVLGAVGMFGVRIVTTVARSEHSEMTIPVVAYVTIISIMVVSAAGTGAAWAVLGATLFYISDAVLAWNRFVGVRRLGSITVMVTYHLGQAGLVAWLV